LYTNAAIASLGRRARGREARVSLERWPRLLLIGMTEALVAPACFAWDLQHTGAAGASLLLNFEAAFTVLLGWLWFHEHVGRRVALALVLMAAGGAFLVQFGGAGGSGWGAALVLVATFMWAIDNALTRPLADLDPTEVVRYKGLVGA